MEYYLHTSWDFVSKHHHQDRLGDPTSRARASRMTEISRGRTWKNLERQGRAYRNGPWPPGWHGRRQRDLLSATFLALGIFVWCCHFLLIRLAPDISESWRPILSTALKPETWHTLLSWQTFSDVIDVSWKRSRFMCRSLPSTMILGWAKTRQAGAARARVAKAQGTGQARPKPQTVAGYSRMVLEFHCPLACLLHWICDRFPAFYVCGRILENSVNSKSCHRMPL